MREIKRFNDDAGEWDQPVMVKVNGKDYPTQLYDGVQRFIPNKIVEYVVNQSIKAFSQRKDTLGTDLNSILIKVLNGELPFEDYIEFQIMHGYSVTGLADAIESNVSFNEHLFPGEIEDWFVIENPLWDEK